MTTSRTGRILVTGGFALASLAVPAAIAFGTAPAAFVASCPAGMVSDPISGSCSTPLPNQMHVQAPSGGLGSVDGIPCTGRDTGKCIGLSENGH